MAPPRSRAALGAVLLALALPTGAEAKTIVTHSPDSLAPRNAPAHWLPPEAWVYNHWLPYDEGRLYRVLHITRADLWLQLRDDRRTLAQLAARHGFRSPARLAARLVPERPAVGRDHVAVLRRRAVRTITQGHLAQHLFFHSLHQFALPSAAPDLFGVTDARFRALRRAELSPLAIGRLHGRSPGEVQAAAIAVLRDRIHAGVAGGAMPRRQAAILLRRQLSQLPRWLDQQRYNGPPLTERGALVQLPKDYASNPAISADGRFVAYESYRQKLKLALKLGEIAVLRTDLVGGGTSLVSGVQPAGPSGLSPVSNYNPSISGDGAHVTYESSAGNQNFAKRYGRIGVMLCHLTGSVRNTDEVQAGDGGPALADSKSSYNPALSADGRSVAYEAIRDGRTSVLVQGQFGVRTAVAGSRAGGTRFADPFEPGLSADGSRVVVTMTRGRAGDAASGGSRVEVRDLTANTTTIASRADGVHGRAANGASSDGAISPDGSFVAFTSSATNLGGRSGLGLYLRDLAGGRTVRIPTPPGLVLDPAVAAGGGTVAFTVVRDGRSSVRVWHRGSGEAEVASRASGSAGTVGDARADDPSISADGTKLAFAATGTTLAPGHPDGSRAVYVRDLTTQTTTRVSDTAKAYEVRP